MAISRLADHPLVTLLFFLERPEDEQGTAPFDIEPAVAQQMESVVANAAASREWVVAPPEHVDTTELPANPRIDLPIRTVGAVLELYAKHSPAGEQLHRDVDRAQLADVETLMAVMTELSRSTGYNIGLNYDGEDIGYIERGEPDASIVEGLIRAWHRDVA